MIALRQVNAVGIAIAMIAQAKLAFWDTFFAELRSTPRQDKLPVKKGIDNAF